MTVLESARDICRDVCRGQRPASLYLEVPEQDGSSYRLVITGQTLNLNGGLHFT
jgi:hypothetical protein